MVSENGGERNLKLNKDSLSLFQSISEMSGGKLDTWRKDLRNEFKL